MEKNNDVRVNQDLSELDEDVPKLRSSIVWDQEQSINNFAQRVNSHNYEIEKNNNYGAIPNLNKDDFNLFKMRLGTQMNFALTDELNIEIISSVDFPAQVICDEQRISQVFINVLARILK